VNISGGFARYSTDGQWHMPHFEKMLYNQVNILGGFARYSTDGQWHVPHFEKILYDQVNISGGLARYFTDKQWHVPHFEKMLYDQVNISGGFAHDSTDGQWHMKDFQSSGQPPEIILVALQQLAISVSVIVVVFCWLCSKAKVRGIKFSPLNGFELAALTSEALGAQNVHILQLDSAGADSLSKGGFLQGNPHLLPNNLVRQ
jgi:hypothetical protein